MMSTRPHSNSTYMACTHASTARPLTTMLVALAVWLAVAGAVHAQDSAEKPEEEPTVPVQRVEPDIPESVRPEGACDNQSAADGALLERVRRRG